MSIFNDLSALKERVVEIPLSAPEYPSAWKKLSDCPTSVYALGDISLLKRKPLAVVGSRRTPVNALKLGEGICKTLSQSFVVLTGVADGGDSAAIEGVLQGSGKVICLLAGGFSALPQSKLQLLERVIRRGLILSPHPFEKEVRAYSYEYRNKLLAKLSGGVLVLGAGEKSGALITAKYAQGFHKPIFAFPYPPNSASGAGCNQLIKQGAYLTENAEDIAACLGVELKKEQNTLPLSAEEQALYEALKNKIEAHVTELATCTGVPPFKLRALLSALEVKGLIVATGGNKFSIV